ncbi:deoxyguanosinetriphosphate triphosphohydrolase [Adlercreutzia shanghongiae]|uniref:Deoxyguanosinetriphosphate triphosphohydrolase-like protein n=1 Tax=Adlercreutzia shanghongiae TaxID=3111773 RepID=A0ABU6IYI6_9ACTN|nr:deoxyguanosinetriphosphate triphosphohydrolase [Adlercreutzia sp. R22]MEC4294915.1 deoxyguanosinetriphosphate triphosphohydrolase [Adlercreutzia sp. R22]
MRVVYREDQLQREHEGLSEEAALADGTEGRRYSAEPDVLRTDFQRDRDKILHSKSFRRLSHKTQVFLASEGDHFRTRLTHTLEVSQIARTITRALGLNEDLTEAISLGHDLGHTPFGHTGEAALASCLARHKGIAPGSEEAAALYRHNEQSVRVVERIENGGAGLNLTMEVRDGILNHTGDLRADTCEGRIVATADRIAYVNHDIDDAIRAGLLREADLPEATHRVLGGNHSARIETLVTDMVRTSAETGDIAMSPEVWDAMMELRAFLFANVYTAAPVMAEVEKATHLIGDLFDYYADHIEEVPEDYRAISEGDDLRAVTDYIAGMTDRYATATYRRLFIPRALSY